MFVKTQVAIALSLLLSVSLAQSTPCPPSGCPAHDADDVEFIQKRIEVEPSRHSTTTTFCEDIVVNGVKWHDSRGFKYTCETYRKKGRYYVANGCYFGDTYQNMGYVANGACCACGGGLIPTTTSTTTTTTFCEDIVVNGVKWHDSAGSGYNCVWYKLFDRCAKEGHRFQNMGYVAKGACCACGGGLNTPTLAPTPAPTLAPTPAVTGGGSKKACKKCLRKKLKKCKAQSVKACIKKACSMECDYFLIEESAEEQGETTFNTMDEEEGEHQEGKTTFNTMDAEDEDDENDEADLQENKVVDDDEADEADFEEDKDVDADAAGAEHH